MVEQDLLVSGADALKAGDWLQAKAAFEAVLEDSDEPSAQLGLSRSLWWLQDIDGAVLNAERAYAGFRSRGDRRQAARLALWLSREYAGVYANEPASTGWFARAEGLVRDEPPCVEHGWLAAAAAERASVPAEMRQRGLEALDVARTYGDPDLESEALARVGYADVALGNVVEGTTKLDEAMAAATGEEVGRLETIGTVTCVAIAAFELAADWHRIERWGQIVETWVRQHDDVLVIGFCDACCAEIFLSSGQWDAAEGLLREGLDVLEASGHRARCVHPAAKLAELRLLQGRLEEAEQLLAGYEELPEAAHALASLHIARGEPAVAAAVLYRRLNQIGDDSVLAAPFLDLLVGIQIAQGYVEEAASSAERLAEIGERSGLPRVQAAARAAAGSVAFARGEEGRAVTLFEEATAGFATQGMPLDAAKAKMQLARASVASQPEVAVADAQAALSEFEKVGAPREADAAASFLRELGVAGRTGPKGLELLTRRETEVLLLLGEGLTNAEIAARLYISTKTAAHHVSSILAKLGLKNRSEAAGYALRYGAGIPDRR